MEDIDSSASPWVTSSLGPIGPLLRSLDGQPEVLSVATDLKGLCISLKQQSEAEDPNLTAKCWMSEVRELCYDAKNFFDELATSSDPELATCSDPELEVMILEARTKQACERRQWYEIGRQDIKKAKFLSTGRRWHPVLHPELIDRARMEKLATLLRNDEEKDLKVVSLVGVEGVGKTTLAKRLYHQLAGGEFRCGAFLRVSPKPDMRRLLTSMFTQIRRQQPNCRLDAHGLIKSICDSLRGQRYLIIIDDLWSISVWDIIRRGFPDDGCGSRIITTSQFGDVASACSSYLPQYIFEMEPFKDDQSERLFFGIVFGSEDKGGCSEAFASVSVEIIRKCGGLPLLIINVASLLQTPCEINNLQQWMDIRDSLPPTMGRNPCSEGIREVVNLIYNNLSPELRTCLLYLAMYPEGYTINKYDLVKQWVVEGFTGEGQNEEETARDYFDELVSRGMIQAVNINYRGVLSCTLNHIVHDLIVRKSMEENFIITVNYFELPIGLIEKVRRLSVQFGGARSASIPDSIVVSEVCSLAFFGFCGCADFIDKYKLLRVLSLHVWADQDETAYDLSIILKLLRLRYLKVECNIPVKLPDNIKALQYLETLEVDATVVAIPRSIRELSRLSSLRITVSVLSRKDICILQALPALSALSLHVRVEPVRMILFGKGGFSVLRYFKFRCFVPSLKFEAGSMPDLQNFNLCFNARKAKFRGIVPIGVEHLLCLKEINAKIWDADTDLSSTFRTAISNHPSNPIVDIQLVDSRFFNGVTIPSIRPEEEANISKDDDKGEEEKKQGADSSMSMLPQEKRSDIMSTLQGSSLPVQGNFTQSSEMAARSSGGRGSSSGSAKPLHQHFEMVSASSSGGRSSGSTGATRPTMKLLVNNTTRRVLYAEAGKDVVDYLFTLLTLPISTAVERLAQNGLTVGSVSTLHRSVQKLDNTYICHDDARAVKRALLKPAGGCQTAKLPLLNRSSSTGSSSSSGKEFVRFVKGGRTYMVMDNLEVTPHSTITATTILRGVTDMRSFDVELGYAEALQILKASLESKTVLTDVFLRTSSRRA